MAARDPPSADGVNQTLTTIAMLAAFALIGGGVWALTRPGISRLKAALMVAAGLVVLFNVWINTLPPPPGQ